jgi:hypothetical protein
MAPAATADGTATRIVKPGHAFNRIHVAEVAQAIDAAFVRRADGIFNVADDEPDPAEEVILYGASLLGIAPPPPVAFAQASLSPLAQSFYAESRRARNDKLKRRAPLSHVSSRARRAPCGRRGQTRRRSGLIGAQSMLA